jgi:hypothetical protein
MSDGAIRDFICLPARCCRLPRDNIPEVERERKLGFDECLSRAVLGLVKHPPWDRDLDPSALDDHSIAMPHHRLFGGAAIILKPR